MVVVLKAEASEACHDLTLRLILTHYTTLLPTATRHTSREHDTTHWNPHQPTGAHHNVLEPTLTHWNPQ